MNREQLIAAFLARHGYAEARREQLAQDASFRRYLRLTGGPRPAMLMDAPPPEDVRPFLRVAAHIAGTGLSAPEIIAADETNGLLLEEDLGDGLIATLTLDRHTPPILTTVIDCLVALQRASPPPGLPLWNADAMAQTALGTLLDWWWPAAFHAPAPSAARDDFAAALATMLYPLTCCPLCFVHRDFFAGNLLWLPQREGLRRIGILDFQTAALGHPAYDLVSLLQDARQDSHGPPATEDQAISLYLAARPELDPLAFRTAYAICAAQRHLRVACQWVRLAVRDRRRHYLAYGPRTWRLLESALSHQAAAPLAAAMDRWIPPSRRGNPQGLAA